MNRDLFLIFVLIIGFQCVFSQISDSIMLDTTLTDSEINFKDSINLLNEHNNMLIASRNAYNDGLVFFENLDIEQAINSFSNAITIDSTFSDAYFYRAQCYNNINI